MKRTLLFLLLIVFVVFLAEFIYIRLTPEAYLQKFENELISLAQQSDKTFVTFKTAPLRYKHLFLYGLSYLDARNGLNGCSFAYKKLIPDLESIYLAYYFEDAPVQPGLMYSDITSEYCEEHLGIDSSGYCRIRKVQDHWLIIRSFIPT